MTNFLVADRVVFRVCGWHEPCVVFGGVVLVSTGMYCWTCWMNPVWRYAAFGEGPS